MFLQVCQGVLTRRMVSTNGEGWRRALFEAVRIGLPPPFFAYHVIFQSQLGGVWYLEISHSKFRVWTGRLAAWLRLEERLNISKLS